MATQENDSTLEARRRALLHEIENRSVGGAASGGLALPKQRQPSLSGVRLRTLLLPAFAIVLFIHFGSRAGAPLGVHAAFTPSETGESFAGPRMFTQGGTGGPEQSVRLSPGDVVGTRSGEPSKLELGKGRLTLDPGARAVVASLLPPRVRFVGGHATIHGRLRVVTAMGVIDLNEGEARVHLDESGLEVRLIKGGGELTAPDGVTTLVPGVLAASR